MIVGEKVNIIALNHIHKDKILKWVNNPKLKKLTGTVFPVSDIEHNSWFDSKRLSNSEQIYGISTLDSELIGVIGLKNIDFISRNAEVYLYIGDALNRSKGYGRDALQAIIDFSFKNLNLHKLYLNVFDYNERAIQLYESLGFKQEGILKDDLFRDGSYHNVYLMAIINDGK